MLSSEAQKLLEEAMRLVDRSLDQDVPAAIAQELQCFASELVTGAHAKERCVYEIGTPEDKSIAANAERIVRQMKRA